MSSLSRNQDSSRLNTVAPAFEIADLDLVAATRVPGLTLIVETRQEYAEEEVVAVTKTSGAVRTATAVCSFYRQHGVIRFEWVSPRRHSHVATVEEALCLVYGLAASESVDAPT